MSLVPRYSTHADTNYTVMIIVMNWHFNIICWCWNSPWWQCCEYFWLLITFHCTLYSIVVGSIYV